MVSQIQERGADMILLIWMPTRQLITWNLNSSDPASFKTKEEAEKWIKESGRFEEKEKRHITIVQKI